MASLLAQNKNDCGTKQLLVMLMFQNSFRASIHLESLKFYLTVEKCVELVDRSADCKATIL